MSVNSVGGLRRDTQPLVTVLSVKVQIPEQSGSSAGAQAQQGGRISHPPVRPPPFPMGDLLERKDGPIDKHGPGRISDRSGIVVGPKGPEDPKLGPRPPEERQEGPGRLRNLLEDVPPPGSTWLGAGSAALNGGAQAYNMPMPIDGRNGPSGPLPKPEPTPTPNAPSTPPTGRSGPLPSPSPGPAPVPFAAGNSVMDLPEAQRLDAEIRAQIKGDGKAEAAYEKLLTDGGYNTDSSQKSNESRLAILQQVKNYPEAGVIENLGNMGKRDWYGGQSFEDQQRSAKVIAYNSSATTPGANDTRENTVERLVESDDIAFGWANISSAPGTITYGQAWEQPKGPFGIFGTQAHIELNSDLVPSGPDKLDPKDADAVHVAVNTLAHEVNHTITPGGNEQSYGYFMDEYRAWYVGYEAENGHPPSARDAYDRASYLTGSTSGSYGNIGKALRDNGSDDQKNIVAFMAQMMGLDPATATVDDVQDFNKFNNASGTAPAPVSAFRDDPNNVDNR